MLFPLNVVALTLGQTPADAFYVRFCFAREINDSSAPMRTHLWGKQARFFLNFRLLFSI